MELGFRIPMVSAIPVSLSCNFGFQNPGFQIPPDKIPEFRIAEANISRISGIRIPLPGKSYVHYRSPSSLTLGSRGYFFLIDTNVSRRCRVNKARSAERRQRAPKETKSSRELYQTISTVYFILGILRWLEPVILWGYHPTLKFSGIPTFTLILSLTYSMDNT